jgi:hypothetical protein
MAVVEGGYRNVKTVYMRKLPADPVYDGLGLPDEHYVLFDEDGRKCVCAFDRSWLFYWAIEHEIVLVTVH